MFRLISVGTRGSFAGDETTFFIAFTESGCSPAATDHDFPGKSLGLRIDDNQAMSFTAGGILGCANVVGQLRSGESLMVQFYDFPEEAPKYARIALEGFETALLTALTQVPFLLLHDADGKEFRLSGNGESWMGNPLAEGNP